MSSVFRCDRCKEFYDRNDEDDKLERPIHKGIKIYEMNITDWYQNKLEYFNLCPNWVKDLYNFMANEDKECIE